MKIYFNGWFSGFEDKTNPGLHIEFFLSLFEKVYEESCEIGDIQNSDILCEFDMLIGSSSFVKTNKWKHTYLFSGESTLQCNKNDYTCVLWGERNHKNVVNLPLFVPYIYCNNFTNALETKKEITNVPKNDVCVIISNPRGKERTLFMNEVEKHFNVCYAGRYKNNIGGTLKPNYNTKDYRSFVNQFKFIISMENSREDTYITEKLINGILSGIVPVYWGCNRVHDYINSERFINLNDINSTREVIQKMISLKENPSEWLKVVNNNVFPNNENKLNRTIDDVVSDIKCILSTKCWNHISRIYCVLNPDFEPDRYVMLKGLFKECNIDECFTKYISPTYKHTITQDVYNTHVKEQLVKALRHNPLKNSELSLFLNYKANLEHIVKNYKDGVFIVFESDVMLGNDINNFNHFLADIIHKNWDLIHVGMYDGGIFDIPVIKGLTGYRKDFNFDNNLVEYIKKICIDQKYIEDITHPDDKHRLIRKFHTRCADSFVWKYESIVKYLHWMNNIETNFGSPMDYYMCNFFEKNVKFKHYWSKDEFFKQGSNIGIIPTTIQL